ncbi:hypothetical protein ACW17M_24060, partial [Vreelandella sp. 2A-K22]
MTHDEPCSMAPDDKHDLISGTCSHLPQDFLARKLPVVINFVERSILILYRQACWHNKILNLFV